jgi:hypothetical protein
MSEATAVRLPRRFATWVGVLFALIVFAGFARTYYLKGVFDGPALTALTHVHGVIMTSGWRCSSRRSGWWPCDGSLSIASSASPGRSWRHSP